MLIVVFAHEDIEARKALLDAVKEQYGVRVKTFFSECFGMMDEGYKD